MIYERTGIKYNQVHVADYCISGNLLLKVQINEFVNANR